MGTLPHDEGSSHDLAVISAAIAQDSSLSFAARGLYVTLASQPDVQLSFGQLIEESASSPWEVSGAIAELANRSLIESGRYGWHLVAQGTLEYPA